MLGDAFDAVVPNPYAFEVREELNKDCFGHAELRFEKQGGSFQAWKLVGGSNPMFKLNTIKSNWIISLSSGNQKQRSLKFHHLNQTMESVGNWLFNLFFTTQSSHCSRRAWAHSRSCNLTEVASKSKRIREVKGCQSSKLLEILPRDPGMVP